MSDKIKKEFICTNCGGDAYMGYTARKKSDWNGKIKKNERLCLKCGKSRLGNLSMF